ncbi:FtsK/SpoIIIE domain-containing protein [Haladaptatus sp. DFWS20]|uniref:FtsK/SpoIIIE domain-containing protein n=1 Tax=Haladaptatus sp. DFWS20 TaxID=3403467 RepID=UPI003EBA5D76
MSKAFERQLAQETADYFKENPPESGERFVGQFYESEIVDQLATEFLKTTGEDEITLTVTGSEEILPAFHLEGGTTIIPVRVRSSEWEQELAFHEVTQGFASRLRDFTSSSADDYDIALLLFYERSLEIDTLESARPTPLYASNGLLPLRDTWDSVLSESPSLSSPANALLLAIHDQIGEYGTMRSDIGQLRTLCTLREVIENEEYDRVPDLIPSLGTYLKPDEFDEEWFNRGDSQDSLREVAKKHLRSNQEHAQRIQDSKGVGSTPLRALDGKYEDSFITFVDRHDLSEIPHTKAVKNKTKTKTRKNLDPKFDSFEVTASSWESCSAYNTISQISPHRGIIAVANDGIFSLSVEFDRELEGPNKTSFEAVNSSSTRDVSISGSTVTATASALSPSEIQFLSLEIYINSSTRRGYPTCQFDIAVIPEWFDESRKNLNLQVNFNEGALATRRGVSPILQQGEESPETIEITEEEYHLTLNRSVELNPSYAGSDEIRCFISPADGGDPVTLYLVPDSPERDLSEDKSEEDDDLGPLSDVELPLHLNAIGDPEIWSRNSDKLLVDQGLGYDPDEGEFQTSSAEGISVTNEQRDLLRIEKEIRDEGTVAPRTITREPLRSGSVPDDAPSVPDSIATEYDHLFDHLKDRNRILSTDSWDDETLVIIENILETYLQELSSVNSAVYDDYAIFREIGTIRIDGIDKHWLTPYHPLMLAYGYKIANWRDGEVVPQDLSGGFKERASYSMFSPVGLFPYRYGSASDSLLHGFTLEGHHLWCGYSGANTSTSDTPEYMDQDIAKKLYSFTQTFDTLVKLHPDRPININLINMGDLEPILRGIYQYYKRIRNENYEPPRIQLRVIGPVGQAEQLERFFNEDAESKIRESISNRRTIDTMLRRVSYVQFSEDVETKFPDSHLTFFRELLKPDRVSRSSEDLGSSFRLDGLVPQEAVNVTYRGGETISSSGYADDPKDSQLLAKVARSINALEPVADKEEYSPGSAFRQQIRSKGGAMELKNIWDKSIWVSHVEPQVRLDFYISPKQANREIDGKVPDAEETEPLMIHYSDQYDPSSPGFDVITTTNKQDLYIGTLSEALEESGSLSRVPANLVLQHLVAIDGSFALQIQQAEEKKVSELIGLIGSLSITRTLLQRFKSDYVWFPISLREIAQKDYAERIGRGSGFRFDTNGRACDDLCFVGIPSSFTGELEIKLWIVEAKGGKADAKSGLGQIEGAYKEFMTKFHPSEPLADTTLRRAEFGEIITNIGRRLAHYGVYEDAYELIKQHETYLINGEYEPTFLCDEDGHVGNVVSVDPERDQAEIETHEYGRVLSLPSTVIELLSEDSRPLEEILEFTDITEFEFGEEGEPPELEEDSDDRDDREKSSKDGPDSGENDQENSDETEGNESIEDDLDSSELTDSVEDEADSNDNEKPMESPKAEKIDDGSETAKPETTDSDPESIDFEYDWDSHQLRQILNTMSKNPKMDVELDTKRLTAELESQFKSLGIDIYTPDPSSVTIGPRKIGVNVRPKSGQRIEGILNNLSSLGVHIQAQGSISGLVNSAEGAVRLEIPHGQPQPVHLRTGLEEAFNQLGERLTFPLGVDTKLEHHTIDLVEQRHVLVGGTTGSGKSNFLTALVVSLALTRSPEELNLSLLDPKGVDFQTFADLPHIRENGYIDNGNASVEYLLNLVDTEIEERREILKSSPARTVEEHNEMAASTGADKIPYHVIVIDEFADLILALDDNRDEFIDAVQRLTQTGRAFGISLVIATQRPSANVVPGEIKANLPCRISFELPSNTDSRVILDQPGAEELEGAGDMIVLPRTGGELQLQSYYVPPVDILTTMNLFD